MSNPDPNLPPSPPPQPFYTRPPHLADANQKKILTGLMGILLGNLGIHKFILGNTTAGIITVLVTLTCIGAPVMGIIGTIEGIIYLTKSDEEFYNTYIANRREWF